MSHCFRFFKLQNLLLLRLICSFVRLFPFFETTKIYYWYDWFVHLSHCFRFLKLQKFTTDQTDLFICSFVPLFLILKLQKYEVTLIVFTTDKTGLFICSIVSYFETTKIFGWLNLITRHQQWLKAKGPQINSSIVWVTIRKIKNMEQMNIYYYRVTIIPWIWSFCPYFG